ncbi:c-type cytochrome [Pseudomonas sp. 2FE]|uniref:c-type cytochrome n=1 Tax=Pseudomonas sp. 2FE TaxID=2502190 RepID=UPI0010F6FDB3|nr:c-type cytochrome [Pseudomonas sp. 2FE]
MKHIDTHLLAITLFAASITPAFAADPPPGRLLASQCFQCHGTNGKSQTKIDSINDERADDLFKELLEMKASTKITVMNQQAKVYSDAELRRIADFLGRPAN